MRFLLLSLFLFLGSGCDYTGNSINSIMRGGIMESPISNYDFFWKTESGNIQGFKDGVFELVKIEDEINNNLIVLTPKEFFTIDGVVYFSADIQEANPAFDPDAAEPGPQYIAVEKYFSQVKEGVLEEITALPEKPEVIRLVMNDGVYRIETNEYEGQPVSDIFRIVDNTFCGRNFKIGNYFYSYFPDSDNPGAFIDVQEGVSDLRDPGLYFISDRFTMQTKLKEIGRMWVF